MSKTKDTPYLQALSRLTGKPMRACWEWFRKHGKSPSNRLHAMEFWAKNLSKPIWRDIRHHFIEK